VSYLLPEGALSAPSKSEKRTPRTVVESVLAFALTTSTSQHRHSRGLGHRAPKVRPVPRTLSWDALVPAKGIAALYARNFGRGHLFRTS
jgi:hypothetical protein